MFKKMLLILTLLSVSVAHAAEKVSIVFAFGPADSVANYSRSLVEEANRIQNKYTFIFLTKPGAGNAIAANYVLNNPNTILATSSAFFIRPIFYPNESYDVKKFRSLMPQCDAPMVITSSKYKSWSEVPKNKKLNLGTTGLGVTSHLIALQITEQYPNIQLVPFKSPSDIMSAILSDSIDFGVGFISESEAWSTNNQHKKLHILGTTGNVQVKNYPLLYKQGFPNVLKDLNNPQHLVVSSSTDDEKFHEWRLILSQAERSQGVRQFYNIDNCIPLSNNNLKINQWFDGQATRWKSLTTNINLNK